MSIRQIMQLSKHSSGKPVCWLTHSPKWLWVARVWCLTLQGKRKTEQTQPSAPSRTTSSEFVKTGGEEGREKWPVCETTNYIMSAKALWELDQLSVQMICAYPNFTHQRFLWVHFGNGCVFPCGEIIHLENMQPKWCGAWITLLVLQMLLSFKHHGS